MNTFQASVRVDCRDTQGELKRIWTSIGYDEINWTYTPRGKTLYRTMRDFAEAPYYVRNHNTFTSGIGLSQPAWGSTNVYHEMPDGLVRYDWGILDQIYDTFVGVGFRPLIELGFMPRDLVPTNTAGSDWLTDVGRESYEADGLWKYPPKDYARWAELVYQLVHHCVERHGRAEVERWYFEVWNEPNLPNYWKGTFEDYCRLYDYSVAGATRALPTVKIGGPAVTRPGLKSARNFLARFLQHCTSGTNAVTGKIGTRLDFVSFHTKGAHYSQRRIYNPYLPVERECPSSSTMIRDIQCGLETLARFPDLKTVPVLVDECDPAVGTIYGVYDNPNFIITNTEYYPNFLCALVKRILDLNERFENKVELMTTWAFYFEGKRFFEGNRTLVTNENIEKPILNAFRLLAKLGTTRVRVRSSHARDVLDPPAPSVEIDALAAVAGERVTVLVWHQSDEWWHTGQAQIQIRVEQLPFAGHAAVRCYQIDNEYSNAHTEWVRQGSPQNPTDTQIQQIKNRQGLELWGAPHTAQVAADKSLTVDLELPRFGTGLIEIEKI